MIREKQHHHGTLPGATCSDCVAFQTHLGRKYFCNPQGTAQGTRGATYVPSVPSLSRYRTVTSSCSSPSAVAREHVNSFTSIGPSIAAMTMRPSSPSDTTAVVNSIGPMPGDHSTAGVTHWQPGQAQNANDHGENLCPPSQENAGPAAGGPRSLSTSTPSDPAGPIAPVLCSGGGGRTGQLRVWVELGVRSSCPNRCRDRSRRQSQSRDRFVPAGTGSSLESLGGLPNSYGASPPPKSLSSPRSTSARRSEFSVAKRRFRPSSCSRLVARCCSRSEFTNTQRGVWYGSQGPQWSLIGVTLRSLARSRATDPRKRRVGQSGEAESSSRLASEGAAQSRRPAHSRRSEEHT